MNRRFALIVTALAGCSSQPGPITQTEYCNRYAQDVCAAISPACLLPLASCTAGRVAECSATAQANAGRDFLPPNAEACLSKVNATYGKLKKGEVALSPQDLQTMHETCSRVYQGTGLANGLCAIDADCLGNLICDKNHCGTQTSVPQGGGCANIGEVCTPGFYCGQSTGIEVCVTKVGLGGACDDSTPCLENLRCSGVCSMQLDFGQACAADQDCSSGFCEPYAAQCAGDVRFANGSAACAQAATGSLVL